MSVDVNTLNIPTKTVSALVELLAKIYTNAVKMGVSFKKIPTPMLWGPPGIGKSEGVKTLAERLEKTTGKRVDVTNVSLLLNTPVDLRGVPFADVKNTVAKWLKPEIFNMDENEDVINILFLDELSAAPQQVQTAAYQITYERRVGEHIFPDNCIVIAAGNRTTDQSVSYKMPKALCNRLMHYDVVSDVGNWRNWALENGVSEKIVAFIGANNGRLNAEPGSSDLAYTTPRSWTYAGTLSYLLEDEGDEVYSAVGACVGMDAALEYKHFAEGIYHLPDVSEIFAGRCNEYPKSHDGMYALISEITARVTAAKNTITVETLNRIWMYASRLPKDYAFVLMKDLSVIDSVNKKLMQCNAFQNWLLKNKFNT